MNLKEVFNHIAKNTLLKPIIEFRINENLIIWTNIFIIDQKVKFVIYRHNNKEQKIETRFL